MVEEVYTIQDRMMDFLKTGGGHTYYCGFKGLAPFYSVKAGGCTDWTGYPISGKTEMLLEVLVNQSTYYGHKHLLYMPDSGSNEELVAKLITKYSGKTFKKYWYDDYGNKKENRNQITQEEIYRWLPEVLDNFKILNKQTQREKFTPEQFWKFAMERRDDLGGVFSAVIDSWNYMKHDSKKFAREDKWLEYVLSHRNDMAEDSGMHFHTIIHPKNPTPNKDGVIKPPTAHDIKGGSEFFNNGKSIIVVHRESKEANLTDVYIRKAKPEVVGKVGMWSCMFDIERKKYFTMNSMEERIYAAPEKEEQKQVEPNTDFDKGVPWD